MNEQVAFLSLARRLGNPIANQPEAIAAIEDYDLVSAFRALPPRHRRVVQLTLDCLARWHRPIGRRAADREDQGRSSLIS